MMTPFEIAAGSTIGRDHREMGRNYQDAWVLQQTDGLTIGVVADGCGSGRFSEVGARLGSMLLASNLREQFMTGRGINWARAQRQVLARLDLVAVMSGSGYRQFVEDHFLFTLVGIAMTPVITTVFALGDGVVAINDEVRRLGPFPDNMPPYLGYGLLEGRVGIDPDLIVIEPIAELATDDVDSWLIGTDGVGDYIDREGTVLPGLASTLPPLSDFWENDRYYSGNAELLSRQLRLAARDWPRSDPYPGLLHDDTTILVGRRERR